MLVLALDGYHQVKFKLFSLYSIAFIACQQNKLIFRNECVIVFFIGIKELTPGPQMMPPQHMNMSMPPPSKLVENSFILLYSTKYNLIIENHINLLLVQGGMMPPNLMNMPPQMVPPPQHNINMIGPPGGMPPMMPPVMNPTIPPNRGGLGPVPVPEDHRGGGVVGSSVVSVISGSQPIDKRNEQAPPQGWRSRDTREKERDYRDRDRKLKSCVRVL